MSDTTTFDEVVTYIKEHKIVVEGMALRLQSFVKDMKISNPYAQSLAWCNANAPLNLTGHNCGGMSDLCKYIVAYFDMEVLWNPVPFQ